MNIPKMIKIKQIFNDKKIFDIEKATRTELENINLNIKTDSQIAIAVGSRGITNIKKIIKTIVDFLNDKGAKPFIIPAMGSHGEATASGQVKVLSSYGITEEYLKVPIKSSMEVVELPQDELKNKVYIDKIAFESDGIIIINRIKPHTSFHGIYESGLFKMLTIGLGKHKGAIEIHKYGIDGLKNLIYPTGKKIIKYSKIMFGLAIVENAYDDTAIIKVLSPEDFDKEEPELLKIAKLNMPHLPVDEIDILIIDEMGKNISGLGIDPNIIGRLRIEGEKEPEKPKIRRIIVSEITKESNGNATGMGLSDFITKKFFKKIDLKSTYENSLTTTFIERIKIPVIMDNDKEAFLQAIRTLGNIDVDNLRVVRIKNTLKLDEVYVSRPIFDEIKNNSNIKKIENNIELFNDKGKLKSF